MMRRIDLLPAAYAERRRQRRNLTVTIVAGVLVLLLLIGWYALIGFQIDDAKDELAEVQAENAQLQADIDELQRFAELEAEIRDKTLALATAMTGDIEWPSILTEIAMVIPGEVWLETLNGSANAEGATQVGTETAEVDISADQAFGRIAFTGRSLTMPGVAKWLIRLGTVRDFAAIWLNTANVEEGDATRVPTVLFDSTIELDNRSASGRFQGARP